jgi:hypothetical protein
MEYRWRMDGSQLDPCRDRVDKEGDPFEWAESRGPRDPRNALALRKPWLPAPPILESHQLAIDEDREEEYLRGKDLHNGYINEFDEEEGDTEAWRYYKDCKRRILRQRERERREAEWNWMRAREQHAMELRRRNAPLRGVKSWDCD